MKRALFATVAIITLSIIIGGVAQAAPLIIKIAHEEPANIEESSAQASAVVFKSVIETESNGEMEVKIYAASSLGNQRDRMEQVKSGIFLSLGGDDIHSTPEFRHAFSIVYFRKRLLYRFNSSHLHISYIVLNP